MGQAEPGLLCAVQPSCKQESAQTHTSLWTDCSTFCLQGMAAEWPALKAFGNNHGWDFPAFEQSMLNEYYGFGAGSKIVTLPDRFNWKGGFLACSKPKQSPRWCLIALHL